MLKLPLQRINPSADALLDVGKKQLAPVLLSWRVSRPNKPVSQRTLRAASMFARQGAPFCCCSHLRTPLHPAASLSRYVLEPVSASTQWGSLAPELVAQ